MIICPISSKNLPYNTYIVPVVASCLGKSILNGFGRKVSMVTLNFKKSEYKFFGCLTSR